MISQKIIQAFDKKYLEKYSDKAANDYAYYHISKMVEESIHEGLVNDANEELFINKSPLNTPLLALMHDTAHDLDTLRLRTERMGKILKERKEPDHMLWVHVEYIRSAYKNLTRLLDEYYIKMKKEQ